MYKPTGAFFSNKKAIDNAFSPEIQKLLSTELNMLDDYYNKESFKIATGDFSPLNDVEYIFSTWGMPVLSESEIERYLPRLKAVFYAAGTVQPFARPFMKRGVRIFSAWGANAVPVAETVVSEIILANKGFFQTLHRGGEAFWQERDVGTPHPGNFNTSVGIIGAGMIGTMVIERLKQYKLNVKVFDVFMSEERAKELGVEKVNSLPQLFKECHVVSNHLANNPQTVNMIDKTCFDLMEPNGIFINTGRGQQVVESDLIQALKDCPSRCAVLDVTYPEPPENGNELYTLKNVYLTPHMAGSIGNEVQRMGEYMYSEFLALKNNRPVKYEVSEKMLETMA
ncbi:MAG: hydroxyacid dehydrogenase [Clostridia bacterium]|nr:hydroxyacid dehydrogenase [Clostridia bacterium]